MATVFLVRMQKVCLETSESPSARAADRSDKSPGPRVSNSLSMPKFKNLNQRQALFCQHIAEGLSGVEAFKRVTPGSPRDCDVKAAQMRRKPGVEERIRELMRENDKRATLSREQALKWLTRVITTGAGDVDPHDPLCQSHKVTSGDGWESHEVKIPDKLVAMHTLGKMCNWFSPEKFEIGVADSLRNYLLQLRSQSVFGGTFSPTVSAATGAPVIELEAGATENGSDRQSQ